MRGKLNGGNAFKGLRLCQEPLVLALKPACEHVEQVGFREGLHQRVGFPFGFLEQGSRFAGRHHGGAGVDVDGHGVAARFSRFGFWRQHGVREGQNQAAEGQKPRQQNQQISEPVARAGLFLNVPEEGHVGERHALEAPKLEQVQGHRDGERQQTPEYVRTTPHRREFSPIFAA